MAKHGKNRRPIFVSRIDVELGLGALTTDNVVAQVFSQTLDQEVWAISADVTVVVSDHTAGDGPFIVGIAHSDYSAAEIEEWLEEASSWLKSNKIGQERAKRKCRIVATFAGTQAEQIFNDGNPKRIKLGFALEDGMTLQLWAYNASTDTFTTGSLVHMHGKAYLRPQ